MIEYYSFQSGSLKKDKYKSQEIASLDLEVDILLDDFYAEDIKTNLQEYNNGVKIGGELTLDLHKYQQNHIKCGDIIDIEARYDLYPEDYIKFKAFVLEMLGSKSITVKESSYKRYCWLIGALGRPIVDKLGIWPEEKQPMKVFLVKNFLGDWPPEMSAVVLARNRQEADFTLKEKLISHNLPLKDEYNTYYLEELDASKNQAILLNN